MRKVSREMAHSVSFQFRINWSSFDQHVNGRLILLIFLKVTERDVVEFYEKNVFWTVDFRSDFARIARILTGNAIGLALGGGGARLFLLTRYCGNLA